MSHNLVTLVALQQYIDRGDIILTPNLRLARRIKQEWDAARAAAGDKVWPALAVYPIENWLLDQWRAAVGQGAASPLTVLNRVQELQLWQQVIEQWMAQDGEFSLLLPAQAAELAAAARDTLLRWQKDVRRSSLRSLFDAEADTATFLTWLERFDARLAERGLCCAADCIAALAECDLPRTAQKSARGLVLVECEDVPPLVAQALNKLGPSVQKTALSRAEAPLVMSAFAHEREEQVAVAKWAAQLQRTESNATVGIVLHGGEQERVALEYLLRREFDCLGENYNALPVNFSAGIPLASAPVVRDALRILALGLEDVAVPDLVALLHSRFITLPDKDSVLMQRLIVDLYDGGSERVRLAALRDFANNLRQRSDRETAAEDTAGIAAQTDTEVDSNADTASATGHEPPPSMGFALGRYLLAMATTRELQKVALPSLWPQRFVTILEMWGWPGDQPLDSLEFQQVGLWHEVLEEFAGLDAVCQSLSFAQALGLLQTCCSRKISHPETADTAVQVLGPLEAVGLAFDHLWVCGMEASQWPTAARPNPFIPIALQASAKMPHATAAREWEFAATLLRQYRSASGVLHTSYCRTREDVAQLPSPLLAACTVPDVPPVDTVAATWRAAQLHGQRETLVDAHAPALSDDESATIGGGSALVERQSNCPFQAFAHHRLRVEPLGEFLPGLSPAERGTLVHEALYHLWGVLRDHATLVSIGEPERRRAIDSAIDTAVPKLPQYRRIAVGAACLALEKQRLQTLLENWLDVEARRGDFRIAHREEKLDLPLARLSLELRVDRIDELADGTQVIIDYKTGVSEVSDWLGPRPRRPQLLLYGLGNRATPAALAFAQIRSGDSQFVGLGEAVGIPGLKTDIVKAVQRYSSAEDWHSLNEEWRTTLQHLAQAFVDGDARVDPLAGACTFCGLQALCRVNSQPETGAQDDDIAYFAEWADE